jgi:hypothetical protein
MYADPVRNAEPYSTLRPRRVAEVVVEDLGEELSAYLPDRDRVVILNHSAAAIWRLIDGTIDSVSLNELLAATFDVAPQQIRDEVQAVLVELHSQGFVEWVAASNPDLDLGTSERAGP